MAAGRPSVNLNRLLLSRRQITNQLQAAAARTILSDFHTSKYETRTQFPTSSPSTRLNIFPPSIPYQRNFASQPSPTRTREDDNKITIGPKTSNKEETDVVYYGPISSTIKKVKLLSLSTCCLSASLGPVITFMTSPDMNVIVKGAVASTVIVLSASTTAALHWFVSPYVHKLRWRPGSDSFEVEMMTWLATYVPRTIKFSSVRPPETNRPFVSFRADGNFYFVDGEHCHNKALLARLTPRERAHESAFKNL
ncbi:uncharacterized protein LOC110023651 [Phalaenopsis equestris]|uniref:uncharacterized protein LOC110023651 n=1 Tax=Phalaenopsis equestris TaxID=78828 RepID=UPI0009E48F37|nr:uncharacterized protein LOC110023651 [Phalaenopsis equestris]XP_020578820.1 uncharacterized protein LOC110023651 [Phalaenopsis equestris]XP_020578821.1 uncharacterized protein LOC110023651 [Phalaenopsis equestris]XP_020578822.1 uncharacterized protein LOC110023651 [Phalaenopsis equestris]